MREVIAARKRGRRSEKSNPEQCRACAAIGAQKRRRLFAPMPALGGFTKKQWVRKTPC